MIRRWLRGLAWLVVIGSVLGALALLAVYWIAGTDWAREEVRRRIVAEVERITGGEVTLREFRFHDSWLVAEVRGFRLRGKEPRSEAPLFEAESVRVGFKIISLMQRKVDLASLEVNRPQINLIVNADGTTNLPEPKVRATDGKPIAETLIDLRIGSFLITDGVVAFADRRIPLEASGQHLTLAVAYDARRQYRGTVRMDPLVLRFQGRKPLETVTSTAFVLEPNRLRFADIAVDSDSSTIRGSAEIPDFRDLTLQASLSGDVHVGPLGEWLEFRRLRSGEAAAKVEVRFRSASDFRVAGEWTGNQLAFTVPYVSPGLIQAKSKLELTPAGLQLTQVDARALGGRFTGTAKVDRQRFDVEGDLRGILMQRALAALPQLPGQTRDLANNWSGSASGSVQVSGDFDRGIQLVESLLTIEPAEGARPVSGMLDVRYDAARNSFEFEPSYLTTGSTRVELSGDPQGRAAFRFESRDLADLSPLIDIGSYGLKLNSGRVSFTGVVAGGWKQPVIEGSLDASDFIYRDVKVDALSGAVNVEENRLGLRGGAMRVGGSTARVDGSIGLHGWRASQESAIDASVNTPDAAITQLARLAGVESSPVQGRLSANLKLKGTAGMPRVDGTIAVTKGEAYGEPFDRAEVTLTSVDSRVELSAGRLTGPAGVVRVTGTYDHAASDYRNGRARFEVITERLQLERLRALADWGDATALLSIHLRGSAQMQNGGARLSRLEGNAQVSRITYEKRPMGNAIVAFAGTGDHIDTRIDARMRGARLAGNGSWEIQPGYPGELQARIQVPSIAAIRRAMGDTARPGSLDFDGSVGGTLHISGNATDLNSWKGSLAIPDFRLHPVLKDPDEMPADRFTLRNEGPVELTLDRSVVRLQRVHVVGTSTNLELEGSIALNQKRGLDVQVKGGLDLGIIDEFSDDLTSAGALQVNASFTGTLAQPSINGKLEMKDASLGLEDSPAGLSNVEATIVFNNREATIQKLNAAAGGGKLEATGFVERLPDDLAFRLEGKARQVRVRYPEGVSSTSDADVTWAGTTASSLVSGRVTVLRAGFNPRSDLSSMLAMSAEPVRTPSARSGLMAGIQFDVLIDSAPNLMVESALTQDIQAEASLRLRGTAFNPVLLGRVAITQGEMTFFGTRYNINQGTIDFLNPVRLEPILNLDMETRVRGIDVILTFTGPINKLRITHRADPPLQFSEVVQLLATGRAPASDPSLAALQASRSASVSQMGATALLGQAIATPVSNRLQRFFGVSKLKIDPNLTGVDNRPQARVTIEQQVTRNITFTYITDVQRSNQQIVRMEWAVNRNYSLLVVREENGVLGVDMLYRKGFR